jgi:hypothetical protein
MKATKVDTEVTMGFCLLAVKDIIQNLVNFIIIYNRRALNSATINLRMRNKETQTK